MKLAIIKLLFLKPCLISITSSPIELNSFSEIELIKGDYEQVDVAWNNDFDFIARHFFELGFQAKTDKELVEEVYSHIDSIKDTADRMTSGNFR